MIVSTMSRVSAMELGGCLRFFVGGEIIGSYFFCFVFGFLCCEGQEIAGGGWGLLVPDCVVQLPLYSAVSYLNRQFLCF